VPILSRNLPHLKCCCFFLLVCLLSWCPFYLRFDRWLNRSCTGHLATDCMSRCHFLLLTYDMGSALIRMVFHFQPCGLSPQLFPVSPNVASARSARPTTGLTLALRADTSGTRHWNSQCHANCLGPQRCGLIGMVFHFQPCGLSPQPPPTVSKSASLQQA
jgi:hypothetical protein